MKRKLFAMVLAVMFLLSTSPVFANGTAPPPPADGGSNPYAVPCMVVPAPFNVYYCYKMVTY